MKNQTVSVSFVIKGKTYSGQCILDDNFQRKFFQLENRTKKLMGVIVYRQGPEITIRVSNGIMTSKPFTGPVFYESATFKIDGRTVYSVPRGEHVMLGMAQFHKRFMTRNGETVMGEVPQGLIGIEKMSFPEIPRVYQYGGKRGAPAYEKFLSDKLLNIKATLKNGVKNQHQYFYSDQMGPFMPYFLGDSGSGAPGGWGIHTTPYIANSPKAIELCKLENQCMMDRHWVHMYDERGNAIPPERFVKDGVQTEWFHHIGGYFNSQLVQQNVPEYYKTWEPQPWTTGKCSYLGAKYQGGLRDYEYIDDAHLSRATQFAKYLAYVADDMVAQDDLIAMANFVRITWTHYPITGYYADTANTIYNIRKRSNPRHGAYIERSFGWACDTICQAYPFDSQVPYIRYWVSVMHNTIEKIVMPNGLFLNAMAGSHLHGVAMQSGMPPEYGVSGAIYVPIVLQGLQASTEILSSITISDIIDKALRAHHTRCYPAGPSYYVGVSKNGEILDEIEHPVGGLEGFNSWWALPFLKDKREFTEFGSKYVFNKSSLNETVNELFKEASQGAVNRLTNACGYIDRVQKGI